MCTIFNQFTKKYLMRKQGTLNTTQTPVGARISSFEKYGLAVTRETNPTLEFDKSWNTDQCTAWLRTCIPKVFEYMDQNGLTWFLLCREGRSLHMAPIKGELSGINFFEYKSRTGANVRDSRIFISKLPAFNKTLYLLTMNSSLKANCRRRLYCLECKIIEMGTLPR